uniref:Mg-dependent DNase n=1 Tax=uncultured prokaryote TaxID=198431 RepID=H5SEK3_9ZZZZ|nr:Mg-dependent DNase [uncultured prokaryote]
MIVDTHAHLDFPEFDRDRDDVVKRAKQKGVEYIITIGAGRGFEGNISALEIAERYDNIFCTVGIHPHDASWIKSGDFNKLRELIRGEKVVAIGETGLDFYRMNSPQEVQIESFRRHIRLAMETGLPLVLHIRDAYRKAFEILKEEGYVGKKGVIHCFSGSLQDARDAIDLGLLVSFSGSLTFENAKRLRHVASNIPVERVMLETDSPFLSPEPVRGRRNEPSFVVHVAKVLAEVTSLSYEDIERITSLNVKKIFGFVPFDETPKIAYKIRDSLYLNITNRCTLSCTFCAKFKSFEVKGHNLRLKREPTVDEILSAIGDPLGYKEIVFCGFGEPLLRLDVVKAVGRILKEKGARIRIDTDGLANLVHGRNVVPELKGIVDCISVSINAPDPKTYAIICPSHYGERAFFAVKEFILEARKHIGEVIATCVDLPGLDVEACRRVVEEELGVRFRLRKYNEVG